MANTLGAYNPIFYAQEALAYLKNALGLSRFNLKYSAGLLPHERLMSCIELYGRRVAPLVREQLG